MAAQTRSNIDIADVTGTATVTALGIAGDGLADKCAIAGAVPGDVITDGQITTASPHRRAPPCAHFGACGGCLTQHVADAYLVDWKAGLTARALRAQGLPEAIHAVHVSPPRSRRRATFTGRRTKKTIELGFLARRSDSLIPIDDCPLVLPEITAALPALRAITRIAASRRSRVKLAVTAFDDGLDLAVENGRDLGLDELDELIQAAAGFVRLAWNGEVIFQHHRPSLRFGRARVTPPPGAFLQATATGEAAIVAAARAGITGAARVVDLFAGCGTLSLPLAEMVAVHAVEFDPEMLNALAAGWRSATGLKPVSTEARDLFRRPLLAAELKSFDIAVLDPPRAGAAAQIAEIAASDLARLVYVSCNPASFARDARVLCDAGFTLDHLEVIDQFRWSPHVELAAHLSRPAL